MPNWVTHRVVVTGPEDEIERFSNEIIVPDEGGHPRLDFPRVIAIPEALENVPISNWDEAAWTAWYGPEIQLPPTSAIDLILGMGKYVNYWLEMPWAKKAGLRTREDFQEYLLKRDPKSKIAADKLERNRSNYGAFSSYDWAIRNWGTKWNSRHFDPVERSAGMMEFRFDTAWSPPEPIFWELSRLYPKLRWDIKSFDEGHLYAMKGLIENGEGSYEEVEATPEIYEEVYGVPLEEPGNEE